MTITATDHETGKPTSILVTTNIDNNIDENENDIETKLIEFIEEYKIEHNEYKEELLLFIWYGLLDEFTDIIWESFFDEYWHEVTMKFWYICIDIKPVCEFLDIDIDNILKVLKK